MNNKDYYENKKELLRERAKNKYRKLSEEKIYIKREYGKNRYHNMSEEKKKDQKNIKKIIVRLEGNLHNDKTHYKIAIAKIFFVCASINF